ncbi:MAG: Holliday junction resolvase RuvX [Candidatus Shikimatogenerans sp. Tduv]|uniref:Putative pre-16S rRNA nuclease n=1 Tax=Candidatus Shikimatogenerans sp. Tduv TaxID=3158567 RepID=A0AAU7QR59_9FLAO
MAKIISIDYGLKNSGIAFSNNKKNIIYGAKNLNNKILFLKIKKYIIKYNIKYIIIGWPINYQNKNFKIIKYIKIFLLLLINKFPNLSYNFIDERFTTSYFKNIYNIKKKTNINYLSAILILKSYLLINNYEL